MREAKKRLRAIEEFSEIGSGFNIAMRDLGHGEVKEICKEQTAFVWGEDPVSVARFLVDFKKEHAELLLHGALLEKAILNDKQVVEECAIETDLELLLPDTYVNSVAGRLSLYKQLDTLETDEELATFKHQLEDRFGKVPEQTEELIETIKMRRLAKQIGLEKVVLKRHKFVGTFITDSNSTFYQSPTFERVLEYVKNHPNYLILLKLFSSIRTIRIFVKKVFLYILI